MMVPTPDARPLPELPIEPPAELPRPADAGLPDVGLPDAGAAGPLDVLPEPRLPVGAEMSALSAELVPDEPPPRLSYDQVLSPYVYIFYAAFIVAFVLTPLMRRVALHFNVVDQPDGVRKSHLNATAYLGGVAVFTGWFVGLVMTLVTQPHDWAPGVERIVIVPISILAGALIVMGMGLVDDVVGLTPKVKITGQLLAAGALVVNGVGTEMTLPFVDNVASRLDVYLGIELPWSTVMAVTWATSVLVTAGIIVFCCNATNLMDGLDGLCGGVTAVIAAGFLILAATVALRGAVSPEALQDDAVRVVVATALLAAVLGFLPYNFNPASIFMGDAGSLFLGFACGTMIVLLGEVQAKWLLAASVIFALPVLDTVLAFARRWVNGRPVFSADKQHFHHQLVARGLSVKQAVLTAYGLAIFFMLCGVLIVFLRTRFAVAFYLVLFGFIVVAAYKIGMIHEREVVGPPADDGRDALGNRGKAASPEVAHGLPDLQTPAAADALSGGVRV